MSDVPVWSFFAYMTSDADGRNDENRRVGEWQIPDVLRWAMARGYDNVLLSRDPVETVRFEKAPKVPVEHRMYLVKGANTDVSGDAA